MTGFVILNDFNAKEIARSEAKRLERLMDLGAIPDHEKIDLSYLDVSRVTDFSEMFMNIGLKRTIDVSTWNLSEANVRSTLMK